MFAILLVVFIDLIGFGIIIPLLPFYAETFDASPQKVTMLMVVYSLLQFLAAPIWGALSDKYGRRIILLVTLFGSIVAYIFLAYASNLAELFCARGFAGLMAGNIAVAQAYIADITEKEYRAKAMGMFGAAFGLGFIIGPAIGGALAGSDPASPNVFIPPIMASALSAIAFLLSLFLIKNSTIIVDKYKKNRIKNLIEALSFPNLRQLIVLLFFVTCVFAFMESTFALWSERAFNWGAQQNGYFFAIAGLCGVVVQGFLIGPLVKIYGESFLCFLGTLILGIGMLGISVSSTSFYLVLISMLMIACGLGLFLPTSSALIINMVDEEKKGWVLGVTQSISSLARIVGPGLAGLFFENIGRNSPYIIGGIFIIIVGIIFKKFIFSPKKLI